MQYTPYPGADEWDVWFDRHCKEAGIKAITVENLTERGYLEKDYFTSSKISGNYEDPFHELNRISTFFQSKGVYRVVREKIETVPWHPIVSIPGKYTKNLYFESHLELPTRYKDATIQILHDELRTPYGLAISRNIAKGEWMATYRRQGVSLPDFKTELAKIIASLGIEKHTIEVAMYDTNLEHDREWTG